MKYVGLSVCLGLMSLGTSAFAEQHLKIAVDRTAHFSAAVSGVTRLSVQGDRIRKLVHGDSAFETMNDEETGDVFYRYVGDQAKPVPETGHLITESGATIAYEITPHATSDAETVVIEITGQAAAPRTSTNTTGTGAAESEPFLDPGSTDPSSGSYGDGLVAFARKMIVKHIDRKPAPHSAHGAVVASDKTGAFRARVLVASGGAKGRYVRPQDFQGAHVLAVWVEKSALAPNERAWVLVVETAR